MVHFNSEDLSQVNLAAQRIPKHAHIKSNIYQSNITQHYTSHKTELKRIRVFTWVKVDYHTLQ